MNTGLTDKEILGRILQGDTQLYSELVKRHQCFVFTIALRYTRNRENAEELSQDIFVKAYKSLASFREDCRFSTWLYTIATNCCLSFVKKKKILCYSLDDENVSELAGCPDVGSGLNQVEKKSKLSLVNEAIRLLNTEDAYLITLFYQAEQSLEEIGKILAMDPNTIKVRLHRARGKLKEKMITHFKHELEDLVH